MEVFVFPLKQVVFFPDTSKPLNIFEPRYLKMVNDSLLTGTPIALAYVDEDFKGDTRINVGNSLDFVREVAGIGHPLVLEQRPDSTLVILMQSKGKVKLGPVIDRKEPYLVCQAELLHEERTIQESQKSSMQTIEKTLIRWIHQNIPEPAHREQLIKNMRSPSEVIGVYASYLITDSDMQQLVLESDDINRKIELITRLIASGETL